jgi:phage tail-like protein
MADELLRAFRFRVKLRRSPGASGGVSASASLSVGASASISAGIAVDAGAAVAGAALGLGASLSASASIDASATAGVGAAIGVGTPPGPSLGDGAFQECTGLEVEMDVAEYLEGGSNARVVRRVGRAKYQNLVLKRGMLYAGGQVKTELWAWLQDIVNGVRPVVRYDGTVQVMSAGDEVVATWQFERGLPARVRGPELNAKTGEIAIEELHIAHEGLRLLG